MKVKFKPQITSLLMIMLVFMALSCKKNENDASLNLPTLTTYDATSVSSNSAQCGGNILSDGGYDIIQRGVCYSTHASPTTSDSITKNGDGAGNFTSYLTGLLPETKYFVRAYAINSYGTSYGSSVTFSTDKLIVKDIENNEYKIVLIGSQTWMAENLRTTKYKDGTPIPNVKNNKDWGSTPAYWWYNNDSILYSKTYGALYNWYTVNNGNLCPTGWHVPTNDEWTTLTNYLGGENVAGKKLKEAGSAHWPFPNNEATNEFGFSALPAGNTGWSGNFTNINAYGLWWSATTKISFDYSFLRLIASDSNAVNRDSTSNRQALSIRCLKN